MKSSADIRTEELRKLREWMLVIFEASNAKADRLDPARRGCLGQSLEDLAKAANWTRLLCDSELSEQ